jgi:hypothetical protein
LIAITVPFNRRSGDQFNTSRATPPTTKIA